MTIQSTKDSGAGRRRGWLTASACLLLVAAGCGGGSSVSVGVPGDNNGPIVGGTVSMPNGEVAAAPSALEHFAAALTARVEALVAGNVRPVGGGVSVRLVQIDEKNIVGGQIRGGDVLFEATTSADGAYALRLPTGTDPNTCRFLVEVGSNATLTRAFVYGEHVNIDYQSEAAVRLLLEQIKSHATSLCALDANEIKLVNDAVVSSQGEVFGDSAASVNASAAAVAAADPGVQNAIAIAVGAPTPAPSATDTAPIASATATATATVPRPTATSVAPTATRTPAATRTATSVPTNTVPVATHTATATNTVPAPTATGTALPTNTAQSTATNTAPPTVTRTIQPPTATSTSIPTSTAIPTGTATAVPTNTTPPTPTATRAAPQVNLGIVSGTAGAVVSVSVTLVTSGAEISAVSNDIEYDGAALAVAVVNGSPDCTIDARLSGAKQVHAHVTGLQGTRKRLRVGVIGATNNTLISSGALYSCRFAIDHDASGAVELLNAPAAADPQANAVVVEGSNGRIDVTAGAAALGLSTGTAAAGGVAVVTASVNARGQALAAVATDIHFNTALLSVVEKDGSPDCTIDASIGALGKEVVAMELPDGAGKGVLRVGVIGRENDAALPTDTTATVFRCRFAVQATSGVIILEHSPEGAAPNAQPVGLVGEPGSITVQ